MTDQENTENTADTSAHTPGTRKGEEMGGDDETGEPDRTARDSTSINSEDEEPIDSQMPNMPPA